MRKTVLTCGTPRTTGHQRGGLADKERSQPRDKVVCVPVASFTWPTRRWEPTVPLATGEFSESMATRRRRGRWRPSSAAVRHGKSDASDARWDGPDEWGAARAGKFEKKSDAPRWVGRTVTAATTTTAAPFSIGPRANSIHGPLSDLATTTTPPPSPSSRTP